MNNVYWKEVNFHSRPTPQGYAHEKRLSLFSEANTPFNIMYMHYIHITLLIYLCVSGACHGPCMDVGGQLTRVVFFLQPLGPMVARVGGGNFTNRTISLAARVSL